MNWFISNGAKSLHRYNTELLSDLSIVLSFSFIILSLLVIYFAMHLVERFRSFRDMNKRKELRITIMLLFVWVGMAAFIFFHINFLRLSLSYPTQYLIFWGSLIANFLTTVFADDQTQRIKNGGFGALAAGGVTAIATLISDKTGGEDQLFLLLFSFYGSMLGALFGWLVFALIASFMFYKYGKLLPFLELVTSGFGKFREQIILLENNPSLSKLQTWMQRFETEVRRQSSNIESDSNFKNSPNELKLSIYQQLIRFILMSAIEQFNLIYGTVQFRSTIITFYETDGKGRHDFALSYYGSNRRFRDLPFDSDSKAAEMVSGKIIETSKTFDTTDPGVASRESTDRYVSFTLFKLSEKSVLSVDWGQEETKQRLQDLEDRINESLVPLLGNLVKKIEKIRSQSLSK